LYKKIGHSLKKMNVRLICPANLFNAIILQVCQVRQVLRVRRVRQVLRVRRVRQVLRVRQVQVLQCLQVQAEQQVLQL
jgi:hypothetical protein